MRLYFARHGESEANVQRVFSNRPGVHGLTQRGRAQAEKLADLLQDMSFAALYCSPVLRAVQTAEIVGARLGIPHVVEDGLREYDVGILEGRTYDGGTEELYWQVVLQWMVAKNWEARIEGGESYDDIRARFMPLIRRLEREGQGTESNVLLISHGGTLRAMLPLLLSNVDHAFALESSIAYTTVVVAERRGSEWVCLRWGEDMF
jgi:probable phosphoglycerate mutase